MSWWKAFIIGFCIYWVISIVSFVLFVCFGLGYSFSEIANKISEVLAFPVGTGKNYNIFLSMFFWIAAIAIVIKILVFFVHFKNTVEHGDSHF